jgi:hypothetical protein
MQVNCLAAGTCSGRDYRNLCFWHNGKFGFVLDSEQKMVVGQRPDHPVETWRSEVSWLGEAVPHRLSRIEYRRSGAEDYELREDAEPGMETITKGTFARGGKRVKSSHGYDRKDEVPLFSMRYVGIALRVREVLLFVPEPD